MIMDFKKHKDVIVNVFTPGDISNVLEFSDDDIDADFEISERVPQDSRQNDSGESSNDDIQPRATFSGSNDKSPFACRAKSSSCWTNTTAMYT